MAKNLDIKEVIAELFWIIFIVALVFLVYQVLRAIIGGTWETENIIIAGMGIILAGMFVIVGFLVNQGKILGMLDERTKNIGASLSNLGKNFKEHITRHKSN